MDDIFFCHEVSIVDPTGNELGLRVAFVMRWLKASCVHTCE